MLDMLISRNRGYTENDSFVSRHSFTYGSYINFERMGFSVLQSLNEGRVKPGQSFRDIRHDNMEILTYVFNGELIHTDSLGNTQKVSASEFQLLSSGAGVEHSEANGSQDTELHFLEISIIPNQMDVRPGYQQRKVEHSSNFQLLASHKPGNAAMFINQDAEVYRFTLDQNRFFYLSTHSDAHKAYVHLISGKFDLSDGVNNLSLEAGDGVTCADVDSLEFIKTAEEIAEGLLIVLPGDY